MPDNGAVIITGKLDDTELTKSIDKLVGEVDEKFNNLAKTVDNAVNKMQSSLNKLNFSQSNGEKRTQSNKEEAQSISNLGASYDALATAMRRASAKDNATEIQNYRMELHQLESDIRKVQQAQANNPEMKRAFDETKQQLLQLAKARSELEKKPNLTPTDSENLKYIISEYERLSEIMRKLQAGLPTGLGIKGDLSEKLQELKAKYEEIQEKIRQMGQAMIDANWHQMEMERSVEQAEQRIKDEEAAAKRLAEQQKQAALEEKERAKAQEEATKIAKKAAKELREQETLKVDKALGMSEKNMPALIAKVKELKRLQSELENRGILSQPKVNQMNRAIERLEEKIESVKKKQQGLASQPSNISFASINTMSEKTLDDIALKMKAISQLRQQMPISDKNGIAQLNMEYSRLSKMQSEILCKNASLISSNNALGRSFNYIKNRLAFALTIGALTGFTRSLLEVRGQYELLERSLGVLMDNMERGSQIFNELNEMALKSPFTLIELGTAAKQLSAYNFAADEVVDTTRRLADISSALGVPMERLVYNLGQIKAQGVLNARDARDFANAGLAIVPLLAEMYTEQKRFGEQAVTTTQVYDMMKKKMVTYNDVLRVIQKTTDEGGKFFDFQAKQAGTLKVQLANLNLAWNNMLNDIGKENQGILSGGVGVIRDMLKNWKQVIQAIKAAGVALGVYKAVSMLVGATHAATWGARALINIKNYIAAIKSASGAMATFNAVMSSNVVLALASALAGLITYFTIFNDKVEEASQEVKTFGENGANALNKVKTLEKILKGSEQTSSTYKKALGELNGILDEYGVKQIKESDGIDVVNQKRRELIELIKKESAERERANQLMSGEQRYEEAVEAARKTMEERLRKAQSEPVISGLPFTKNLKEVQENAAAISEIIASVVQNRVQLIAGKTGEEWEKGFNEILKEIQDRMRHIGISEATIKSQWLTDGILRQSNIVSDYINVVSDAKHAQDLHNESVEKNYKYSKDASEATMTFTQKVEANARALRNNSKDAVSLYNRIMDIVKVAEQNHIINFDLRLTAQNPPQWMFDKSLPELEKLARNFAAIAKSAEGMGKINVNGTMFTREEAYERALQYASAAKEKQYKEEQKAQDELNKKKDKSTKSNKANRKSSDELAKALQNEISLIKKLQSEYDKLTKAGVTQQEALALVQDAYGNTLSHINATMRKYKLPELDLSIIKGRDPNSVLKFFTTLRDILSSKGLSNIERMKAVEGVIEEFTVSAKTYNLDKITKGLNNELGKIKEEYELAVELDANPELGDMFAQAFGIDTTGFPKTVQEAVDMMQDSVDKAIAKAQFGEGIDIGPEDLLNTFDILRDDIDEWSKATGIALDSNVIESIKKMQKEARDLYAKDAKQTISDWQKLLEKYAEYETKRTEIQKQAEKERETARKHGASQEIIDAINLKEQRELAKLDFDEFQKSATWITATGDLSNLTNKALQMLIDRLWEYKRAAKNLDPKDIIKLNNAMRKLRREQKKDNPFAAFTISMDEAKQRMEQFEPEIQDLESKIKDLWAKDIDQGGLSNEDQKKLEEYIKLYKELVDLQKESGKVPFVDKIGKLAQTVSTNLKSLGELRDYLKDAGADFGDAFDGVVDSLQGVGDGMNQIVSSATSGDVFGVVTGTIKTVFGIGDAIASIFGDGAARTRRINREIENSQEEVRKLNMAYKDLERTVDKAMGSQEIAAQRALIANKKAEKAEIERQMRLEKSKRSKDRDDDAIKQYEETLQSLNHEIEDLGDSIVENLLGSNVKSAAEDFVDTWVDAWKQGENTLDAIEGKMDDITQNLIKKAIASKLVGTLLQPLYDAVDNFASETSEGGVAITMNELQILSTMLQALGVNINDVLTGLYNNLESIGIISKGGANPQLSALQQGISSITEETASAVEAYLNSVSQQVYYQSDILTQIRDILINFGGDVTIATNSQILFELQQSYQVQMSIQSILQGWSNASGLAVRVEMV